MFNFKLWLRKQRSALRSWWDHGSTRQMRRSGRTAGGPSGRRGTEKPGLDLLEDRTLMSFTPVQTYLGPMPETNIRSSFGTLYSGTSQQINSVISLATTSTNTRIVYDQWEDGYETDIANPIQASTQIWGDGNTANGVAPGYPTD